MTHAIAVVAIGDRRGFGVAEAAVAQVALQRQGPVVVSGLHQR